MKINKKGYMLVEIIVSFVLAFSIAMYLLNLTIKFKDTNEEIYYSANYTKDRNLIVRNIMDDLEKGTVTYVSSGKDGNNNYVNFKLNINGVEEFRKLKINSINNTYSIEYGKTDDTYTTLETSHSSYYKKSLNPGLIISGPQIVIDNNVFRLTLPVESMYSDERYDIKLIAPCYAVSYMAIFDETNKNDGYFKEFYKDIQKVVFYKYITDDAYKTEIEDKIDDLPDEKKFNFTDVNHSTEKEVFYSVINVDDTDTLYIVSENTIVADSLSYLFAGMTNLKEIDFGNLQTVVTKEMNEMFYNCSSLTKLNLGNFDTSSVTNMASMFQGVSSLKNENFQGLDKFNTSSVIDMSRMFQSASSLEVLDLENFNTSNVKYMNGMFADCANLKNIDLISFDTRNVENMSVMFSDCSSLTSLDVSSFDTEKVTDMSGMFQRCSGLTSLDLDNFNTGIVTNMKSMFYLCSSLTSLDVSSFNTEKVTDMSGMFSDCSSLTSLDLGSFKTDIVTTMKAMFAQCTNLTNLDISNFNTNSVTTIDGMFQNDINLKNLNLGVEFYTTNVTNTKNLFKACNKIITTITIRNSSVSEYTYMFSNAATESGASIKVNYTSDTSSLVDDMINTKSATSNVIKGELVS